MRWYLLLAFVSAATPVRAQEATAGSDVDSPAKVEEQSRRAFEAGEAAYARKEFGIAAAEFQKAYALLPSPVLLYDMAQAERLAGRCGAALADYRQFVAEHVGPLPADLDDKIAEVEHCSAASPAESRTDSSRATLRSPEPPPVQASRPPPVPAPDPPLPAWVGWTAASVGAAGLVAGTVMAVMVADRKAIVERTCVNKVCRDQSGIDAAAEGQALFVGSIAAYAVGGAGLGFGIYVLSRDSSSRAPPSLAPSAAVLTWGTGF